MGATVARPPLSCATRLDWAEPRGLAGGAERPLVWAGSGVLRSGAWEELRAVAETLRAPVVTSYMGKGAFPEDHELSAGSGRGAGAVRAAVVTSYRGKGAFPEDHELSAGSGCDEAAFRELVEAADAVLVVGSE